MLVGLTADTVPLGSEETIDRDIDAWALGLHDCPVECAYIVQVDVDREPVETEVEAVERRPALEDEPLRQERVAGDLLQQVQEPQHLFERAELVASVVSHKYAYESAGPFGRRLRCSSSRGARHCSS